MAELDDMHPAARGDRKEPNMPKYDRCPAGEAKAGQFRGGSLARFSLCRPHDAERARCLLLFVVLTLALGIGANTTVFTVINTLILNPLPVQDSGELWRPLARPRAQSKSSPPLPISYARFEGLSVAERGFPLAGGYTSSARVDLAEERPLPSACLASW